MSRRLTSVLGALVMALAAGCDGDSAQQTRAAGSSSPAVDRPLALGGTPASVAVGAGAVWVADTARGSVHRLDLRTGSLDPEPIEVGPAPLEMDVGEGFVWVVSGTGAVVRIDPRTRRRVGPPTSVADAAGLAVGAGAAWVTSRRDRSVTRIDPRTGRMTGRPIPVGRDPVGVIVAAETVWVANTTDGTVSQIDPHTGQVEGEAIRVASEQVVALAGDASSVWAAGTSDPLGERAEVVRIDAEEGEVDEARVAVPGGVPVLLEVGAGGVWVTDPGGPRPPAPPRRAALRRIDPGDEPTAGPATPLRPGPAGLATGAGAVWVTSSREGTLTRVRPARTRR